MVDQGSRIAAVEGLAALSLPVDTPSGLEGICSYDRDFDLITGIRRVEPETGAR